MSNLCAQMTRNIYLHHLHPRWLSIAKALAFVWRWKVWGLICVGAAILLLTKSRNSLGEFWWWGYGCRGVQSTSSRGSCRVFVYAQSLTGFRSNGDIKQYQDRHPGKRNGKIHSLWSLMTVGLCYDCGLLQCNCGFIVPWPLLKGWSSNDRLDTNDFLWPG